MSMMHQKSKREEGKRNINKIITYKETQSYDNDFGASNIAGNFATVLAFLTIYYRFNVVIDYDDKN